MNTDSGRRCPAHTLDRCLLFVVCCPTHRQFRGNQTDLNDGDDDDDDDGDDGDADDDDYGGDDPNIRYQTTITKTTDNAIPMRNQPTYMRNQPVSPVYEKPA